MQRGIMFGLIAAVGFILPAQAADIPIEPPFLVNYQGVLRDASDRPLSGSYDMVFRFFDAELGGNELLVDSHNAPDGVTVTGGLFDVALGSGLVADGSGPGSYDSLAAVFGSHSEVWVEIQIATDVLTPRVRVLAVPYALNAGRLNGAGSGQFLRSDVDEHFTGGILTIDPGTQLEVLGALTMDGFVGKSTTDLVTNLNADLLDGLDSSAFAAGSHDHAGSDITSAVSEALNADTVDGKHAGDFIDTSTTAQTKYGELAVDSSSLAASYAVRGWGTQAGGQFTDADDSGYGYVGWGDLGVRGFGNAAGGYFQDLDSSGNAYLGYGDRGIEARGNDMGGYFGNVDGSAFAEVGKTNFGISAQGNQAGGYFRDMDGDAVAYLGFDYKGIEAKGQLMGGYFLDTDSSGWARIAYFDTGVMGFGNSRGGYFEETDGPVGNHARAEVASQNVGIFASGTSSGGEFRDLDGSAVALVAREDVGIEAFGNVAGGYFRDQDHAGAYARVGQHDFGTDYKIRGGGTVSFVQNHPEWPDRVVVYAAPEGDEVAVYTRGTARLVDGNARIALGETFRWVTNPDIGLTAYVTPIGAWSDLYVAEKSTEELVVKSNAGNPDARFDYIVYGLRIGYEQMANVQVKQDYSPVPAPDSTEPFYSERPELRRFNALERFKAMRAAVGLGALPDRTRSPEMVAAINRFDPEIDGRLQRRPSERSSVQDGPEAIATPDPNRAASRPRPGASMPAADAVRSGLPVDDEGNVYGRSFRPSATDLASLVSVGEAVEAGDVLVIDPQTPGIMRRSTSAADTGVFGIVAAEPGVVLGSRPQERTDTDRIRSEAGSLTGGAGPGGAEVPVAVSGVVLCKVDAGFGSILPGDLLTTSPTAGHAMRADDPRPGTILGKALEPLDAGSGRIKVLVMLR